jgi:glyoxylase-like metal-dependent hydrolase (beta-lactamase superfamily II)
MTEEIRPNLYRIVVPLPDSPLKEINSYIIKSDQRNLIVDTGMNRPECQEVLEAGLKELEVDLERTDFLATHLHADHQGLISTLMSEQSKAYMGAQDTPSFRGDGHDWSKDGFMGNYLQRCGFPAAELEASLQNHPGFKYSSARTVDYIDLHDRDRLDVGDYSFEVMHTPGHTDGHICLYEENEKLFISGDHVLGDITPNIASWSEGDDPLEDYLQSLAKVSALDVELCLPGHRSLIHGFKERIRELETHHFDRANEVIDILQEGDKSAYETAALMTWSIRAKSWQDFPVMQRWFATGEAIAHLHYVEGKGLVSRAEADGEVVYHAEGGRIEQST